MGIINTNKLKLIFHYKAENRGAIYMFISMVLFEIYVVMSKNKAVFS